MAQNTEAVPSTKYTERTEYYHPRKNQIKLKRQEKRWGIQPKTSRRRHYVPDLFFSRQVYHNFTLSAKYKLTRELYHLRNLVSRTISELKVT
jgi:hypothetical protein